MTPERMSAAVRREVLAVYAAADAAVRAAGPRCDASGRCCRFTEYGHTLFLSHFEAELLLEATPPYDTPVSRDGCPFQIGGLCTARDARPLGCRIYFCDPAYQETGNRITEDAVAALKRVADAHAAGWSYAPLHVVLNAAERPAAAAAASMSPDPRRPLPVVSVPPEVAP